MISQLFETIMFVDTSNRTMCDNTAQASSAEGNNQTTAIALSEMASKFYAAGQQNDALAIIEMADQVLQSSSPPCPEILKTLRWGSQKLSELEASQQTTFQHHPHDLFLEGDCDVGPRPIRSPLHVNVSMLTQCGENILQTVLTFNKGLALHSKSHLDGAMEFYSVSLQSLAAIHSSADKKSTQNHLNQLSMVVHNNMGQLCYIGGEEHDAQLHFQTALYWGRQAKGVQGEDFQLLMALVLSNFCRTQWVRGCADDETLEALQEVLRLRLSALPKDHGDVVSCYYNLGLLQHSLRYYEDARKNLKTYLAYSTKLNTSGSTPEFDPIPAITLILLMENEDKEDQFSVELVRALHVLQDKRDDFGTLHIQVASILNYIGTLLFHQQDLYSAILFYREELRIEKALMDTEVGINVSVTYNNIGRILQELGKFPEAISCYQRALKSGSSADTSFQTVNFPKQDENVETSPSMMNLFSTVWYNLGLIHDKMGARIEAISAFQKSLEIRRTMLGNDHPDVACLWYNIGTLQMEQNKLGEASASFKEALRIRRLGKFSEESRHLLATMQKLASLQQSRGNIDGALSTLEEVLHIYESSDDYDTTARRHIFMGLTLSRMSDLHHAGGSLDEATRLAVKAYGTIRAGEAFANENSPYHTRSVEEASKVLLQLGSLYHENCEAVQSAEIFREALRLLEGEAVERGHNTPALSTLREVIRLLSLSSCAPQA